MSPMLARILLQIPLIISKASIIWLRPDLTESRMRASAALVAWLTWYSALLMASETSRWLLAMELRLSSFPWSTSALRSSASCCVLRQVSCAPSRRRLAAASARRRSEGDGKRAAAAASSAWACSSRRGRFDCAPPLSRGQSQPASCSSSSASSASRRNELKKFPTSLAVLIMGAQSSNVSQALSIPGVAQ